MIPGTPMQAGPTQPGIDAMGQPGGQPQLSPQMNIPQPQQMPQPPDPEQQAEDAKSAQNAQLDRLLNSVNIAEHLDEAKLKDVSKQVIEGFNADKGSREEWEKMYMSWMKQALQIKEDKMYPWPNASNVKFPLISTASMQFAARAYPTLIPSDGRIVKSTVIGSDKDGTKQQRADRVSQFMSYQVLHEMDDWEEDMDKLLFMLPIIGTVFKKTFHDDFNDINVSRLVNPMNLVVNYWTKNLETAERTTEIIYKSKREITEGIRMKLYLDADLAPASLPEDDNRSTKMQSVPDQDSTTPYTLLEQHTWLDLDDDDYPEPYVVLVEQSSQKVLRITPRFAKDSVKTEGKKILKITPLNFYTKYEFIPNPDGGFYGIGFGYLLGPLNESVNTIINILIDSGHLSALQGGFIGKGLRIRAGDTVFKPGEWKPVNATGQDLKQQIIPLPHSEPSTVLYQLLGMLVTSTKELASVAEIFTGKMPGQNTPATTTTASIEQGMKVFTAIYKRIYRALSKEFKKLYRLNYLYVDPQTESRILDDTVGPEDFESEKYDICPAADPNASSQQEKLQKVQELLQLMPLGTLNAQEVTMRMLIAQEQPQPEKLLNQGSPPPDPKQQEMQMKMDAQKQASALKSQDMQQKAAVDQQSAQAQLQMKAEQHQLDMQSKIAQQAAESQAAEHNQKIFMVQQAQKLAADHASNQLKLNHQQEVQKLQQKKLTTGSASQKR